MINSARVELLDDERSINQLCSLERRVSKFGGEDKISHPPNSHDDRINAVALAATKAALPYGSDNCFMDGGEGEEDQGEQARLWRVQSLLNHIGRFG